MTSKQLNEILNALRERMNGSASIQEFDDMLEARNALHQWANEGYKGEIPFAQALRGWNIELPDGYEPPAPAPVPAPVAPTEADVAQIVRDLRMLLIQDHAEWDAIQVAYGKVRRWQAEGMNGPLPEAEQLARWGVWPKLPKAPVRPISYDRPPASPSYPEPPIDYDLQYRYEDALANLREGYYYQARNALRELQQEGSGRFAQQVRNAYQEASRKLQAETRKLVNQARRIQRDSRDPHEQTEAWKAVQKVNPESREANQALAALARNQAEQEITSQLSSVRKRAEAASWGNQLPELNNLLGQVQIWKALGEKAPPEISPSLYQQVVEFEKEVSQLRRRTRRQLSEWDTYLVIGDYRRAYDYGRSLFERAVPTLVDPAGRFGEVDEEIDTAEFFFKARQLFVNQLQSLAKQRLAQAEGEEKPGWPGLALETLDQAINLLTDKVLTTDDKAELRSDLEQIEQKRREIVQQIEKYNAAKAKVAEAHSPNKKPSEALALFLAAKEEYAVYPNLDVYIEQAQTKVTLEIASEVANAMAKARRHMMRDEYQKTFETLTSARNKAVQHMQSSKNDYIMQILVGEVSNLEQEIAQVERTYWQMMNLLAEVDKMFERFDSGTSQALSSARHLLNQFSEEEKRHSEVRKRLAALAEREEK